MRTFGGPHLRRCGHFLLLLALAATLASAQSPDAQRWSAPADAASKSNPLAGKTDMAAGGEKIYRRSCTACHVIDAGKPQGKGPNLAGEPVQQQSDGALFWKISKGNSRSGMPSFSSLPENQRWQLVMFLRTLPRR